MKILAVDPGLKNFAYCHLTYENGKVAVGENGILPPIDGLLGDNQPMEIVKLDKTIRRMAKGASILAAERFMSRGVGAGMTSEVANMALGLFARTATQVKAHLTMMTAAQWKNAFNRSAKSYNGSLEKLYKMCKTTPHQLDAALIGYYAVFKYLNQDNNTPFVHIAKKSSRDKFLNQLEEGSTTKLINRKVKRETKSRKSA